MTAVVPAYRCGAVPDSHRIPFFDALHDEHTDSNGLFYDRAVTASNEKGEFHVTRDRRSQDTAQFKTETSGSFAESYQNHRCRASKTDSERELASRGSESAEALERRRRKRRSRYRGGNRLWLSADDQLPERNQNGIDSSIPSDSSEPATSPVWYPANMTSFVIRHWLSLDAEDVELQPAGRTIIIATIDTAQTTVIRLISLPFLNVRTPPLRAGTLWMTHHGGRVQARLEPFISPHSNVGDIIRRLRDFVNWKNAASSVVSVQVSRQAPFRRGEDRVAASSPKGLGMADCTTALRYTSRSRISHPQGSAPFDFAQDRL